MENEDLVNLLKRKEFLRSPPVIRAFLNVDRADFVLPQDLSDTYEDAPLPIGYEQTISQPSTVAFMLETLGARSGDRVLDIGSGSGWTTALLADIVGPRGKVWGVERIPELVEFGTQNLALYPYSWASIRQSERPIGHPDEAPYDKILVSASAQQVSSVLIEQLTYGGRLVIPVKDSIWKCVRTAKQGYDVEEYPGFLFVPLRD